MSGDVQPRKRKDKKRKKDEIPLAPSAPEEYQLRGTAAVFGDGDILMHSQHDHGTGGHWCAKIIFFSLLAVLLTLVGLIVMEHRGLSDLEASSIESRYADMLEGWIEELPVDDHHDEHTFELKHADEDDHDEHDDEMSDEDHDIELEELEPENPDEEPISNELPVLSEEDDDEDQHDDDNDEGFEDETQSEDEKADESGDDDENDEDGSEADDNDEDEYLQQDDSDVSTAKQQPYEEEEDDEALDNASEEYNEDLDNASEEYNKALDNASEEYNDENEEPLENHDEDPYKHAHHQNIDENNDNTKEEIDGDLNKYNDEDSEEFIPYEEESDDDVGGNEENIVNTYNDEESDLDNGFEDDDDFNDIPPNDDEAGEEILEEVDESKEELPIDSLAEEEEYERKQEELRKQEEQASHVWLKVFVGLGLLAATHAVLSRALAPAPAPCEEGDGESAEAAPVEEEEIPREIASNIKRESERVEEPKIEPKKLVSFETVKTIDWEEEKPRKVFPFQQIVTQPSSDADEEIMKVEPEEIEEVDEETIKKKIEQLAASEPDDEEKELYSEDDFEEEDIEDPKKKPKSRNIDNIIPLITDDRETESEGDEVPDDVEIIDDEQLDEELAEEEEDISDVDDSDLLLRLEAKYGRLPEPERPGGKHNEGGQSKEVDWPDEPADTEWRKHLDEAEDELLKGAWQAAIDKASHAMVAESFRAMWIKARALDGLAELKRDNRLLARAVAAYGQLLRRSERLPDLKLLEVAARAIDRIRFKGDYMEAVSVHRLLIARFPKEARHRNELAITYLMLGQDKKATEVLKETLRLWPEDEVALAHYGFVLKTQHGGEAGGEQTTRRLEQATSLLQRALRDEASPAAQPRFYYHLGDALLMLGRFEEAHEVHVRGAKLGFFLSPAQRSLYNVDRLTGQPWWDVSMTPYTGIARALETSWREILREGEAAKALYEEEREGLRERGHWSQMDLFVRGREVPGRCARAPVTCRIVRSEPAAVGCRRGQVKFSLLQAGTHVRAHAGPTNCRLRMHLALANTTGAHLRVHTDTRQWEEGKVLLFDDSFEHEVWHNGSAPRLVLIVDLWHPELTAHERRTLPAI